MEVLNKSLEVLKNIKFNYFTLFMVSLFFIFYRILKNKNNVPTQNQLEAHKAKALVLNCMDFRLVDDVVKNMDDIGLNNNYDNIVLAGGSLHLVCDKHSDDKPCELHDHFNYYFFKHIDLAISLHDIKKVIIIEHEDCGAYKKIYGEDIYKKDMVAYHKNNFTLIDKMIRDNDKYKNLDTEYYIMNLEGHIKKIIL